MALADGGFIFQLNLNVYVAIKIAFMCNIIDYLKNLDFYIRIYIYSLCLSIEQEMLKISL